MSRWGPMLAVLGGGLLLAGLVVLGRAARDRLRQEERYTLAFTAIACEPPPGSEREAFLGEVQYLAHLPARLNLLDEELPGRLFLAFARHPWVAKVQQVQVQLPDRLEVRLTYRVPVLAVETDQGVRVVDGGAVALPASAPAEGLPVLAGPVLPPRGAAGAAWDDRTVEAAAAVAERLRPHQERLQLTRFEGRPGGLVLRGKDRVVEWGKGPGAEGQDEAPVGRKVAALLGYAEKYGGLDQPGPSLLDVRPKSGLIRAPLSGSEK